MKSIFDETEGWRFYTIDELTEVARIDRENVLTIDQLKAFANSVREFQDDETEDQNGEPYSLIRLAAAFDEGDTKIKEFGRQRTAHEGRAEGREITSSRKKKTSFRAFATSNCKRMR